MNPAMSRSSDWIRILASLSLILSIGLVRAEPLSIPIGLISAERAEYIPLSSLEPRIEDEGLEGARQGILDNNTTGRFTGQSFDLLPVTLTSDQSPSDVVRDLIQRGVRLFLVDLPAADLLELADLPEAGDALLFNIGAMDDDLRTQGCRSNLLHTVPSRAMRADALAQYLAWKRWMRWFLVVGPLPEDRAFGAAIERAAKRFGAKIVVQKPWTFKAGASRTDSGHFNEQQLANSFTQVEDYDILLVADEADAFGAYLNYRTYRPRPIGGTQGLVATAWSGVTEQWGATQFQRRFLERTGRFMTPRDYAAWLAVRSIGEAATRTQTGEVSRLRQYLLGPDFKLAAFKGVPLSFRDWNGQMRQPILIVSPRILVSVSPQEGFLHQFSTLDTLGYDRPETECSIR
ncbi:ABC transporter, substrate binding protein, PQQ-dependent alcohol dehydrogenase system [Thiorhodococcus drewsii AZ1]|uniref:ABC transporter, substrate binding protein, PQQ-dependent alcohol dehydrogenase system n=2 Tax=Thiorhodococcus drewsii TaxID=210408 RepID=G2DX46_9GAMM|nr:ABC transporter, substrate binding protein, PQQ-dependent alcohol dehydrogenase system [Thiorhodococcus drewsii AZ1]